jgi:atypical dual specificity phosphatase
MPPVAVGAAERYVLRVADRTHAGQERFAARGRRLARARVALRILFRLTDRGERVAPGVLGCAYPRTERSLAALSESGVGLLVNLHERPHDSARLGRHGLREVHLPVKDFAAPSPEQIGRGVGAILEALAAGEAAAVHCGGGLGRTGTLLACYLASSEGLGAGEAILRVRSLRPGSVETPAQAAAVDTWARRPGPTRA